VQNNTVVITESATDKDADIWTRTALEEERRKVGEMNSLWKKKCYQLL